MNKNIIIMPTYNEKDNIPIILEEIFNIIPDTYILIIDDNSPDKTAEIVENLKSKYKNLDLVVRIGKRGLGSAYIDGFKKVLEKNKFDTITMMDSDFSHNPKYLIDMLKFAQEHDLVIGSRYVKGSGITDKWELWRKTMSKGANIYLKTIFRYPINDWTNGFNIIKIEALKKIELNKLNANGYALMPSLKYYLSKNNTKTVEFPIVFDERRAGISKVSSSLIVEGVIAPWKIIFKELFNKSK